MDEHRRPWKAYYKEEVNTMDKVKNALVKKLRIKAEADVKKVCEEVLVSPVFINFKIWDRKELKMKTVYIDLILQ